MIASETRCLPSTSAIRTAHEHNHEPPDSGSRSPTSRVQLALDLEETSWRGWGPVHLVDDSFQVASRLPPPPELRCRSANEDFHPTPAEVSRTRGLRARERACRRSPPGEACPRTGHRALCWHTHAQGSLSQARSARAPPVTVPLRSRLESPKSSIVHRTEARRRSKRFRLADVSSRGSRTIHENPICGPTYDALTHIARRVHPWLSAVASSSWGAQRTKLQPSPSRFRE